MNKHTICPCVLADEPCMPHCTCISGASSHGCLCCATYGSPDQRKAAANRLVTLAKEAAEGDAAAQKLNDDYGLQPKRWLPSLKRWHIFVYGIIVGIAWAILVFLSTAIVLDLH